MIKVAVPPTPHIRLCDYFHCNLVSFIFMYLFSLCNLRSNTSMENRACEDLG